MAVKVLLVDDAEDFTEYVSKRLQVRGMSVISAKTGEQAVETLSSSPVDVVVMDIRMPGMGGIFAMAEMKKLRPDIAVLILTGYAEKDIAAKALELGAFDCLIKPVELSELIARIEDAYNARPSALSE
jgi:DNA-binding NtrC family response regulator